MYTRVHNLTNVIGRIKYVTDKEDIEEVIGISSSVDMEFWKLLAKENQAQFQRSLNSKRVGLKASEGREIVVGIADYIDASCGDIAAAQLRNDIKRLYGVECYVAIHRKITAEGKINVHAHIILAERTKLAEPLHFEEIKAKRNYYYDENGRQCKKAEAVKITKKGTVIQEEHTRHFSDKVNFYNLKKFEPFFDRLEKDFDLGKFDIQKHFPQRHIGKNNPKEKVIKEHNQLVCDLNSYFDKLDAEGLENGKTAKKRFCERYGITARFGVNKTDFVRARFEEFKASELKLSEAEKVAAASELQKLLAQEKEVTADLNMATSALQDLTSPDFVRQRVALANKNTVEDKYCVSLTSAFLAELQELLNEIRRRIGELMEKLGLKEMPVTSEKMDINKEARER